QKFIAQPAGGLAGAFFFSAQDCEVYIGLLEQFHDRAAYALGSAVIGAGAAHPIKHFEVWIFFRGWDSQSFGPVCALGQGQPPGVAAGLHATQRGCSGTAECAFPDPISPHVRDQGEWVYANGTNTHACAARSTRPEGLSLDGLA